jgi:hypothetical protein
VATSRDEARDTLARRLARDAAPCFNHDRRGHTPWWARPAEPASSAPATRGTTSRAVRSSRRCAPTVSRAQPLPRRRCCSGLERRLVTSTGNPEAERLAGPRRLALSAPASCICARSSEAPTELPVFVSRRRRPRARGAGVGPEPLPGAAGRTWGASHVTHRRRGRCVDERADPGWASDASVVARLPTEDRIVSDHKMRTLGTHAPGSAVAHPAHRLDAHAQIERRRHRSTGPRPRARPRSAGTPTAPLTAYALVGDEIRMRPPIHVLHEARAVVIDIKADRTSRSA